MPATWVVVVHGLGANRWVMALLSWRLARAGYQVRNWGYASILRTIASHGDRLRQTLDQLESDPHVETLHLVTHSMGGIVARAALDGYRPAKLQRMVMIAPPNRGSRVARALSPYLGSICQPLAELSIDERSFVHTVPFPAGLELGIVAGSADLLVHLDSTHCPGERDHIVLPYMHTSLVMRRAAADQVIHFLAHGQFDHGTTAPAAPAGT